MHPWNQPILDSFARGAERLPHAILLHGMRGVGKLALAERLAQRLLCEQPEDARRPCGSCDACRWYLAGNHPDFRRLEPEALSGQSEADEEEGGGEVPSRRQKKASTQIRVEQVRGFADFLNLGSHRGRRRVVLVHPAEDMNPNAANALLKSLEEPPPAVLFLLVSHQPARLPATIRSRCVAVAVRVPVREIALRWLAGQKVRDAERWLAFAGGAPLRALDYAREAEAWDRAIRASGTVEGREELERLAEALQKGAYDRAFASFGLAPKYGTVGKGVAGGSGGRAWLTYARQMGAQRLLSRHPVSPKLFSAELLTARPED